MGMQIASTMTVDTPSSSGNCVWNPQPLAGSPTPNTTIYVEKQLLKYYNSGSTPAPVPGSGIGCSPSSRTIVDQDLQVQRVKFNKKPIALLGDTLICGVSQNSRTLTGPGIGATIHIGTRRGC